MAANNTKNDKFPLFESNTKLLFYQSALAKLLLNYLLLQQVILIIINTKPDNYNAVALLRTISFYMSLFKFYRIKPVK